MTPLPPPLVASDLDRTLIYSLSAVNSLAVPGHLPGRLRCVELYQGEPLSHLTETAAVLLAELAARTVFVPTTTRTRAQYHRVRLPGPPSRYAVCANGGHLLVDGESDPGWQAQVRRNLTGCASLAEVRAHLGRTADPAWVLKERVAEDLFAYLVVDRTLLPSTYLKELAGWATPRGWTVSLQGRKLYAVPGPLTKSAAVAEIVRRTGATGFWAAGDSLLDADLLLAADLGWRPGHGELADEGWQAPHITALTERGVAAGERILAEALRLARAAEPSAG